MLTIKIICVGKLKENYLSEAFMEYSKRLSAFCNLTLIEVSEYKLSEKPSDANIKKALEEEGKDIFSKISPRALAVAMCIEGKMISSPELSQYIDKAALEGKSEIDFIIGGSWGLSDNVKGRADVKLSMSRMTFPHQLARIMLQEQIYRSFEISSGGKYHK